MFGQFALHDSLGELVNHLEKSGSIPDVPCNKKGDTALKERGV